MEEVRRRERERENQTRENTKGARENEWRVTHSWIIVATVNAMKQPCPWQVSQTRVQNTIHSWYLLFSFCPMMSFAQKKNTNKTTTKKQKGKRKAGVKAKYSQFLFLRHIFVWHPSAFLHIWLSGNKRTTAIFLLHSLSHNYMFLVANNWNRFALSLNH